MLIGLWIRDVVLIEALDLSIGPGLTALTGETGAGKSIILDALGLATGARADAGLVRRGAQQAMAPQKKADADAAPATEPSATVTTDTKDPSAPAPKKKRGWFHIPFTKG